MNAEDSSIVEKAGTGYVISEELFLAARAGDQKAVEIIFKDCYDKVYYMVRSMVKDEDAIQDIVQDTFVQAFIGMKSFTYREGYFQAWIGRIAHNTTVNYVKKKKPVLFSEIEQGKGDREEADELDFVDERVDTMPEEVMDQKETARLLNEILDSLSEEQRLVVGMYYYEQYSVREIADSLGVSENTIKSRLSYGRKKIKEKVYELEKKGTKLYGLSPVVFLLFLFKCQSIPAAGVQSVSTLENQFADIMQGIQKMLYAPESDVEVAAAGKVATAAGKTASGKVQTTVRELSTAMEKTTAVGTGRAEKALDDIGLRKCGKALLKNLAIGAGLIGVACVITLALYGGYRYYSSNYEYTGEEDGFELVETYSSYEKMGEYWKFELNDVSYEMPMFLSELEEAGWEISVYVYEEDWIEAGDQEVFMIGYPNQSYAMGFITLYNPDNEVVDLEDCMVISLEMSSSYTERNDKLMAISVMQLENGIEFGISLEEVEEIMGEPDEYQDGADIIWRWYLDDGDDYRYNNYLTVGFDQDNYVHTIVVGYDGDYEIDYTDQDSYGG